MGRILNLVLRSHYIPMRRMSGRGMGKGFPVAADKSFSLGAARYFITATSSWV